VAVQGLIGIDAWRLRRVLPCLLVLVASLLLIAPVTAAPIVGATAGPSQPAPGPVCLATGPTDCDVGFASAPVVPVALDGAFVVQVGMSLWNGTAIRYGESIAPIPLPAAGWLVLAGMGALGLMRRRGADALYGPDGTEPLGTALRGSALRHAPGTPARPSFLLPQALRRAARSCLRRGWQVRAFSPGTCSPVRPCGGAGHRYAATAERAPPRAASVPLISGPPAGARPTVSTDQPPTARLQDGQHAAFPLPNASRPAAPCGTGAGRRVTTARTGRTRTQSRPPLRRGGFGRPISTLFWLRPEAAGGGDPAAFFNSNQNGVQS
jgi:hypothetical protein